MNSNRNFYRDDLAYIHNVGFRKFADAAGPVIIQQLRQAGHSDGLVVDVGCGGGLLVSALVAGGFQAMGVDLSLGMIRFARKSVPEAKFVRGSLYTSAIPSCIAVTAIGEVINYMADKGATSRRRNAFFGRVFDALVPGGLFFVDFAIPGRNGGHAIQQRVFEGDDWLLAATFAEEPQRLTRTMAVFRREGRSYRRTDEIHELQLLNVQQITKTLRDIGFKVGRNARYGQLEFPPGYAALVARKPR